MQNNQGGNMRQYQAQPLQNYQQQQQPVQHQYQAQPLQNYQQQQPIQRQPQPQFPIPQQYLDHGDFPHGPGGMVPNTNMLVNNAPPPPPPAPQNKVYTSGDEEPGFLEHLCTCLAAVVCCPLFLCSISTLNEYERGVVFRMGRLKQGGRAVGPGTFCMVPLVDNISKVDLRTVTHDVPKQEILTHDSVTVTVDAVMYYRVFDPILAVTNVTAYHYCTQLLAAAMLRSALGMHTLAQILEDRDKIAVLLKSTLDVATDPWGIKVERVELKDVRLPYQMQRAMAAEAEAVRDAKAKVVSAQGEAMASKNLREAAEIIRNAPGALQLRYLQTLQEIASDKNFTIIFPMPVEIMKALARK